jgi:hypothetical protein
VSVPDHQKTLTWIEFRAKHSGQGLTMVALGKLWRTHKEQRVTGEGVCEDYYHSNTKDTQAQKDVMYEQCVEAQSQGYF